MTLVWLPSSDQLKTLESVVAKLIVPGAAVKELIAGPLPPDGEVLLLQPAIVNAASRNMGREYLKFFIVLSF